MAKYGTIKELIDRYFQENEIELSENGKILKKIVDEKGNDILKNEDLEKLMKDNGAKNIYIFRLCLMVSVDGFHDLISCDHRTINSDLMRYVKNAIAQTGLDRSVILSIVTDIIIVLNIYQEIYSPLRYENEDNDITSDLICPIPECVYKKELDACELEFGKVKKMLDDGESIETEHLSIDRLLPLMEAGIPKAKYYAGYYMLNGIIPKSRSEEGLKLIKEAALDGCAEAAQALGDYCYDKGNTFFWSDAYFWYTRLGSSALNASQKKAVKNIYNQKLYNGRILVFSLLLIVASLILVIAAPASYLYSSRRVFGFICVLVQCLVFALTIKRWKHDPYDFIYYLPTSIFFVMFIYFMVRLI